MSILARASLRAPAAFRTAMVQRRAMHVENVAGNVCLDFDFCVGFCS